MRGMWRRSVNDDVGMTLVEIIVSAVILFVILTGVLGLVGRSTSMSAQAKHQNVLTNALGAYVEWLHSLPFEQVDAVGVGEGVLDPTDSRHSFSVGEFQVSITPTVSPGDNDFLKRVRINVQVTRADGLVQEMMTRVIIRDRSQFLTQSARTPQTDPVVEFTDLTVPDGSVVWGDQWMNGSLNVQVKAEASDGRTIDRVTFYAGGYILHDSALLSAEWYEIGEEEWTNSPPFVWNTAHEMLEDDGTYRMAFPNGWITVTAIAYDNYGGETIATRHFYVDNTPPSEPGPPYVEQNPSPPNPVIRWEEPVGNPVYAYEFELRSQGAAQTGTQSPFDEADPWSEAWEQDGSEPKYALTSTPFSRYMARVFSKSPRYDMGYSDYRSDWVEGDVFTTRPLLGQDYVVEKRSTGAPSGRGWKVTANLVVTPPTFPTSGPVTYSFYRVVGGELQEPPLYAGSSNTFTHVVEALGASPTSANFPKTYYAVLVTYTPAGFQGGVTQVIKSNTVLTEFRNDAGTYPFSEGTW